MITQKRLKELLNYDPETGIFNWLLNGKGRPFGKRAGTIVDQERRRHRIIMIDGNRHGSGRLAWLYMTGKWPENEIDHRDRDALNDSKSNLREATRQQNLQNRRKPKDCSSKYKGVYWEDSRKKWKAGIRINKVLKFLGRFDKELDAHEAFARVAKEKHDFFLPCGFEECKVCN